MVGVRNRCGGRGHNDHNRRLHLRHLILIGCFGSWKTRSHCPLQLSAHQGLKPNISGFTHYFPIEENRTLWQGNSKAEARTTYNAMELKRILKTRQAKLNRIQSCRDIVTCEGDRHGENWPSGSQWSKLIIITT